MIAEKDPLTLMQDLIFLKQNPIFHEVLSEELKEVSAIAYERKWQQNERIVTEGEPGTSLFLIKQGSVRITKLVNQKETTLATLNTGSLFGEMVLFEDAPRSASAYAIENCLLLIIEKEELIRVIEHFPGIAIQLFKVMGSRLRTANEKVKELTEQLESSP